MMTLMTCSLRFEIAEIPLLREEEIERGAYYMHSAQYLGAGTAGAVDTLVSRVGDLANDGDGAAVTARPTAIEAVEVVEPAFGLRLGVPEGGENIPGGGSDAPKR